MHGPWWWSLRWWQAPAPGSRMTGAMHARWQRRRGACWGGEKIKGGRGHEMMASVDDARPGEKE